MTLAQTVQTPLEWAAGPSCPPPAATLPEQIVAAAHRHPDAIAIKQWEAELTYRELLDAAAGLAETLRAHSVGPETRVGICTRRSADLPIAVLAVWLAGGAYVSLDPSHPAQRLTGIAEDAAVSAVLVDASGASLLAGSGQRLVRIDAGAARPVGRFVPGARRDNAAYVLYTSGSTGRPKGVVVSHGNVAAFAAAVDVLRPMAPGCRSGGFASLGFDASVFELLIPLARGVLVALVPDEDRVDPVRLQRFLAEHRVTRTMLPPAVLPLLDPASLPELSELFFAGEPCGAEQVERWSGPLPGNDRRHFHNWYGPTETTVIVVGTELSGSWAQALPIGRPLPGCQAYVLDDTMQPCPVGEPGELYIGGPQVTRGYLGQPGHTADRFVPDPYGPRPGGRLYRTGDLVSWQPDGLLAYLGRVDRQVKIHGQRVEAGEVETVLRGLPQVDQAVVDLTVSPAGEQHLVAYLTPSDAPELTQVRQHCAVRLPDYMVPTRVVRLDRLPLNVSGKVDMAALRAVGPQPAAEPHSQNGSAQATVAGVWAEVFESELPEPDRDFIEAGGHSLLAMRLTSALRHRLGRQVSVEDIWLGRTVAGLTERVAAAPALVRDVVPSGSSPALSAAQRRMWFVEQLSPGTPEHNITMTEHLTGSLDVPVLRAALRDVAERQDALRWRFPHADGVPRVVVDPPADVALPVLDLADRPLSELLDAEAGTPFDLSEGPLWRAKLVRLGPTEHVLMITVHHIVFDGWSWHLLYREISRCYRDRLAGRPAAAPLPATFADYVAWLNRLCENERDALDWWSERLGGTPQVLDLPRDRPRPTMQGFRGAQADARIDRDTAARLHRVSLAAGGTPFVTLLAAFGELLSRLSGQSDLIVGTPLADRRHVAFEPVIGFCLQILPLRIRTDPAASFLEQVRRCGTELAAALAHPDIPLERIVDSLATQRDLSRNPLIQVMFNMYNFTEPRLTLPGVTAEPLSPGLPGSLYDLTLYVSEHDDEFSLRAVYNPDLFDADRIVALLAGYRQLLDELLAHPDRPASAASLRSPDAGLPELTAPLPDWSGPGVLERAVAAAEQWPDRGAVEDAGGSLSYADVLRISRSTLAAVRSARVESAETIAVICERARWLPPVLLGLLGSGARWVLLDPALPAAVLGRQVRAAAPVAVIRTEAAEPIPELSLLPSISVEQLLADADQRECPAVAPEPAGMRGYWSMTSGSTGEPKLVYTGERPLAHFLDWYPAAFGLDRSDRFALLAGLGHDPLLRDVFTPLMLGCPLVVPDQAQLRNPTGLADWLRDSAVTVAHLTPQLCRLVASAGTTLPELRLVVLGGDQASTADLTLAQAMAPNARVVTFYGTTETPQAQAYYVAGSFTGDPSHPHPLPVGAGIPGAQLVLLNPADRLAGVGELAEVHIRSRYLADRYADPELTGARFRQVSDADPADRMFRTGDLGRYRADGAVVLSGRVDDQVKIRGFRVELGEISASLTSHPDVRQAQVLVEQDGNDRRLRAYAVPARAAVLEWRLLEWLRTQLPDYAVPADITLLSELPLTANGKVDTAKLRAVATPARRPAAEQPTSRTERLVAGVWTEVLGTPHFGAGDNFFEVGGHSLAIVAVRSRLCQLLGRDIPVVDLFRHPTLRSLAAHLDGVTRPDQTDDAARWAAKRRSHARRGITTYRSQARGVLNERD